MPLDGDTSKVSIVDKLVFGGYHLPSYVDGNGVPIFKRIAVFVLETAICALWDVIGVSGHSHLHVSHL